MSLFQKLASPAVGVQFVEEKIFFFFLFFNKLF